MSWYARSSPPNCGANFGASFGGSAGTAVAAALRVAADPSVDGPVVVVLPDSWDRYLSRDWLAPLAVP